MPFSLSLQICRSQDGYAGRDVSGCVRTLDVGANDMSDGVHNRYLKCSAGGEEDVSIHLCSAAVRVKVSSWKGSARVVVVLPFRASMLGP
jgi:hypothetical protein